MSSQLNSSRLGRNDPCPCGSGRKYKNCCIGKQTTKIVAPIAINQVMQQAIRLHQAGHFPEAEAGYHHVLRISPNHPDALALLGAIALHDHRIEESIKLISRAIKVNPRNPEYHSNLALALQFDGRISDAERHCREAIRLKPDYADAWYNMHALLVNAEYLQPSIDCLRKVVELVPMDMDARLLLGIMHDYAGDEEAAQVQFKLVETSSALFKSRLDAWCYIREYKQDKKIRLIGSRIHAFEMGLSEARVDGLVMEFGVRNGNSIRKIAALAGQEVHGFDSFEGLPEAWHHEPKGSYTTEGKIPEVPKNVKLHIGWFDKTLPDFLKQHPEPLRFMNIDCDIYSSTKTVLDALAERIIPGSVILFDEYVGNEHWREDEYKAFQEASAKYGWHYEYLCFSIFTKQTVVRILSIDAKNAGSK
jgi:Flp pilus assembly protein TadD